MTFFSLAWDRVDFLFTSVNWEEQKQVNPFNKATKTRENFPLGVGFKGSHKKMLSVWRAWERMLTENRSMAPVKTVLRKVKERLCIGMRAGSNPETTRKDKSREAEVSGNLQSYNVTWIICWKVTDPGETPNNTRNREAKGGLKRVPRLCQNKISFNLLCRSG